MTSSIQKTAQFSTNTFHVAILTNNVNTLNTFLSTHDIPTPIDSIPTTRTNLQIITINIPIQLLEKITTLDRVYTIAPTILPTAPNHMTSSEPSLNAIK